MKQTSKNNMILTIIAALVLLVASGYLIVSHYHIKFINANETSQIIHKKVTDQSFNSIKLGNKDKDYTKGDTYKQTTKILGKPTKYYKTTSYDNSPIKTAVWKYTFFTRQGRTNGMTNGYQVNFYKGHAFSKQIVGLKDAIIGKITKERFNQLKLGISYEKVINLVGNPDVYTIEKDKFSNKYPLVTLTYYARNGSNSILIVELENNKVVGVTSNQMK